MKLAGGIRRKYGKGGLMNTKIRWLMLLSMAGVMLSGCMSPRSYMDPGFPKMSYEQINRRNEPLKLKLTAEFQRNGAHYEKADLTLKDNSERILRGTGVITPSAEPVDGEINIVCNNVGDLGSAAAKGIGIGLTFGAIGNTVTDGYELSVSIKTKDGKTINRSEIKHALHTAIGNTSVPEGVETVLPNVAFERVLEQMLLKAISDMQESGELTWLMQVIDQKTMMAWSS